MIATSDIDRKSFAYCETVYAVANRFFNDMDDDNQRDMKVLFNKWKSAHDKSYLSSIYELKGFQSIYTLKMFHSRIQTVWFAVMKILSISYVGPALFNVLSKAHHVISIGCGPGPCIAAFIVILREFVGSQNHVRFIGIDKFNGWRPYVVSMNCVKGAGNSTIIFEQKRIEENTLHVFPNADVCIMSYTDAAIHTPKFWQTMRIKYAFILVLDQRKGQLAQELLKQGFSQFEYEFKGTKRVFYFVNPFRELGLLSNPFINHPACSLGHEPIHQYTLIHPSIPFNHFCQSYPPHFKVPQAKLPPRPLFLPPAKLLNHPTILQQLQPLNLSFLFSLVQPCVNKKRNY